MIGPKKIALWFLIASVAASAVLGIIIVLAGTFSDLQIRIILTTLTISAASICALASGALWESKRKMLLPSAGVILATLTAILYWRTLGPLGRLLQRREIKILNIVTAEQE